MKKLIIVGTGGTSIDILDAVRATHDTGGGQFHPVAFLDDSPERIGSIVHGLPVEGPLESAGSYTDCWFISGIGGPATFVDRPRIIERLGVPLERFATIVHPTASVSPLATIGHGTAVLQHVTVNSRAVVGNHVVILPNSVVSHDCVVGDYTCIASGATLAGRVTVKECAYLGANCSVIGDVTVGTGTLVGIGAVLLKDAPDDSVFVGNPARRLRSMSRGHRG